MEGLNLKQKAATLGGGGGGGTQVPVGYPLSNDHAELKQLITRLWLIQVVLGEKRGGSQLQLKT